MFVIFCNGALTCLSVLSSSQSLPGICGFTLIALLLPYDCLYSVSLPRGAVGWSMICDC